MPNRIVRDEILKSDRWLGLAHPAERLAFLVLLLEADDVGCLEASDGALVRMWRDPCNVKGREDALRVLGSLVDADLARPYETNGKRYLFLPRTRQRLRAPYLKHPAPPLQLLADEPSVREYLSKIKADTFTTSATCGETPHSAAKSRPVVDVDVVEVEVVGVLGAKAPTRKSQFSPPSLEEVIAYCRERNRGVDPQRWLDHYTANGWKVGKNPMRDWQAAVRTWEKDPPPGTPPMLAI